MIIATMRTIQQASRVRRGTNTLAEELTRVPLSGTIIEITEKFVAPAVLTHENLAYQLVGDIWVKTTFAGVTGWLPYIHMGKPYGDSYQEVSEAPLKYRPMSFNFHVDEFGVVDLITLDGVRFVPEGPVG